jgi:hypothetical protein
VASKLFVFLDFCSLINLLSCTASLLHNRFCIGYKCRIEKIKNFKEGVMKIISNEEEAQINSEFRKNLLIASTITVASFVVPPAAVYLYTWSLWWTVAATVTSGLFSAWLSSDVSWSQNKIDATWAAAWEKSQYKVRKALFNSEKISEKMIQRMGGQQVYESELEEVQERTHAIQIPHQAVKDALKIPDAISVTKYNTKENPLAFIAELTKLHPTNAKHTYTYGPFHAAETSMDFSYSTTEATKSYETANLLGGVKSYETASANDNPLAGFSYYKRHLSNYRGLGGKYSQHSNGLLGGIETSKTQFAAVIHDGYGQRKIEGSMVAGIDTGVRGRFLKNPPRIIILGEVHDASHTISIRRLIIDGKKMGITRENVALGLAYAKELTDQIFERKKYDPAAAMQNTLASLPRSTGALPRHGRT